VPTHYHNHGTSPVVCKQTGAPVIGWVL